MAKSSREISDLDDMGKKIRDELRIDVSELIQKIKSNSNDVEFKRKKTATVSFLEMTSKYAEVPKVERKNILRKTCLMIPLGVCLVVSLFPSPAQSFALAAAKVFKFLLEMDSETPPNIPDILRRDIEKRNIDHEVIRVSADFQRAHDFLEGVYVQNNITDDHIEQMINRIGIYIGAREMGVLASVITENVEINAPFESLKAIHYLVQYIRIHLLFTRLYHYTAIVAYTAWEKGSSRTRTENNSFTQFRNVYEREKQRVEEFVRDLFAPCDKKAMFFALFEASKYPEIGDYLLHIGVDLSLEKHYIKNQICLAMRHEQEGASWMNMANNFWGTIWKTATAPDGNRIQFLLHPVPEEMDWFFLVSAQWPSWYAYVQNNMYLSGTNKKPGDEGKFKFVKVDLEDEKYMITVKTCQGNFVYMEKSLLDRIRICKTGRQYDCRFKWSITMKGSEARNISTPSQIVRRFVTREENKGETAV